MDAGGRKEESDMEQVQIIDSCTISPPMEVSFPTTPLKLSSFDRIFGSFPPIRRVLFYDTDDSSSFLSHLRGLKASFSKALQHFPALAGKLVRSHEADELEIDCLNPSVTFVVAETTLHYHRLVGEEEYDEAALQALAPSLNLTVLPIPVMSVQVTRFSGAGMAVGFVVHHAAVDGHGLWQFMKCWTEICRSGCDNIPLVASLDRSIFNGLHENVVISGDHHQKAQNARGSWLQNHHAPTPRTFVLSSSVIKSLKSRANNHGHGCNGRHPVSTFVALSAQVWTCSTLAREVETEDEDTCFFFTMDCRGLIDAPSLEDYRNCIKPCKVLTKVHQLIGEDGFKLSIEAIQRAICEAKKLGIKDSGEWALQIEDPPSASLYVSGSPRFRVYETDFGWGRPSKVELVGMNREGMMTLAGARDDEGGVQLTIALSPSHMNKFASLFLEELKYEKYDKLASE
ncbi:anthocyanin 5-aromatic acyltransferase-like [Aristolochia californica]|uniref:anthocyanin 5-aromatic acyltransferase-like n=1 Tax=Aristolochia californica TaxID=171875 RepID=UPI0035DB6B50